MRYGMGAAFADTGDGIAPGNFQAMCCSGAFGYTPVDSCNAFVAANMSLFGSESPCSEAGIKNLNFPPALTSVRPVGVPPIDTDPESPTYGQATDPRTGKVVSTPAEAQALQLWLSTEQARGQSADFRQSISASAAAQCAAIKADCANRTFAAFLVPNADCTDCVFAWSNPASLFLVAGIVIGGLVLVKAVLK